MKIIYYIFIFLLFFHTLKNPLYSLSQGGVFGFQQRIDFDARLMSLAGSCDALAFDVNSIYYNPSGLTHISRPSLSVAYMPVWDNLTQIFFIGTGFKTKYVPIGIGVINLNSEGIKQRGDTPDIISLMEYRDLSFFAGTAYEIIPYLSIGARIGFYYLQLFQYNDWGLGLDLSLLWRFENRIRFTKSKLLRIMRPISLGLVFNNILPPSMKLYETKTSFPLMIKNSISYRFPTLYKIFNSELGMGLEIIPIHKIYNFSFGAEFKLWNILYLRSGYSISKETFTIGTGIDVNNIIVDYGVMPLKAGIRFYTINCKIKFK